MDYLSYFQDPSVPDEDKTRLLQHLQRGSEKTDWGSTVSALGADLGLGLLGEHIIDKRYPTLGDNWFKGKPKRAAMFRNGLGMAGGAAAGLLAAPLYKHLANYFNPYGEQSEV